ncbi:MAG: DUF4406 domain-containing protein [Acutalibacteraceae bacterium]
MDKYNSEGYLDLTTYQELVKIEHEERAARKAANFRPIVYICSPYSGDTDNNTKKARLYSRFAVTKGTIPLAVHLLFPQYISEKHERPLALFMGAVILGKCKEVWVFGDTISEGMASEIAKAKRMGKIIRYFTEELEEITHED